MQFELSGGEVVVSDFGNPDNSYIVPLARFSSAVLDPTGPGCDWCRQAGIGFLPGAPALLTVAAGAVARYEQRFVP